MTIHQITHLAELDAHVRNLPDNTLILFDLNYVLLTPRDAFFRPLSRSSIARQVLAARVGSNPDPEAFWQLYCQLALVQELIPVEQETVAYLQFLRTLAKHKLVLLSSIPMGQLGLEIKNQRCAALERYQLEFDDLLFAAPPDNKSTVLRALLSQELSQKPAHILFIDDMTENIRDISQYAHELGIPSTGIEYRSHTLYQEPVISLGHAQEQLAHFERTGKWLSDVRVKTLCGCACDYCASRV